LHFFKIFQEKPAELCLKVILGLKNYLRSNEQIYLIHPPIWDAFAGFGQLTAGGYEIAAFIWFFQAKTRKITLNHWH